MDETAPPLPPELFESIQRALELQGPAAAIDTLCTELREAGDYQSLFYALLLKKRVELGVSPFPTSPASELPPETHEPYEEAIRRAGREAGHLYLARHEFGKAWSFFRMLGEPDAIRQALETYSPGPDDDTYEAVDLAWQQGLHPEKGFDLVLDRHGICSAITMIGAADLSRNPELRDACVQKLVRSLHSQLLERLRGDLAARGATPPADANVSELIASHPELFADDAYHIDVSHLSSVVQFASQLSNGQDFNLARELCEYGEKLSGNLRSEMPPPFDRGYADYKVLFDILSGRKVDAGIAHFRAKCEAGAATGDTYPAEMLVNLLLRLDRLNDALDVATAYLTNATGELNCPPVTDLARRAGDYAGLASAARANNDAVNWLAGLIAGKTRD
jgi:hypothetical protein